MGSPFNIFPGANIPPEEAAWIQAAPPGVKRAVQYNPINMKWDRAEKGQPTNGKLPDPYPPVKDRPATDIKGYRNLSDSEVKTVNDLKTLAESVGDRIAELGLIEGVDPRWLAIATTQLQLGFMAAIRAVAQPDTF